MPGKIPMKLLDDTTNQMNVVGEKIKAAGYNSSSKLQQSVSIHTNDFVGRVQIQGSLATDPTDQDWFNVDLDPDTDNTFVEYPKDPMSHAGPNGDTGSDLYEFRVNAVWLRATVSRDYLTSPVLSEVGTIRKILVV